MKDFLMPVVTKMKSIQEKLNNFNEMLSIGLQVMLIHTLEPGNCTSHRLQPINIACHQTMQEITLEGNCTQTKMLHSCQRVHT